MRIYLSILVFCLPFLFGSYASGLEQPNFPVSLLEWLVSGLTPSWPAYLAPIFSGVALLWAVCKYPPPRGGWRFWLPLAWGLPLLAGLVGLVRTTEMDVAFNWLMHFSGALALALAVKWSLDHDAKLPPALLTAVSAATVLLVLCGLYQHFYGLDSMLEMFRNNAAKTGVPLDFKFEQKLMQKRIYSFFIDPNLYAAHLVLSGPLTLVALSRWARHFNPVHTSRRVFLVVGGLVLLLSIYWTGSRGGAIGACAAIVIAFWCHPFIQRLRWRWCLPIVGILLVAAVLFAALRNKQREGAKSASARVQYYTTAVKMFQEQPLTGVGLGEYFPNYLRLKPIEAEETRDPHCFLLGMLAQNGILGGLAALCALGLPFALALKRGRGYARLAALGGLAGWSVHTLFEFNELIPGTFYLLPCLFCFALPRACGNCRLPQWSRIPAAMLALVAMLPLLRVPAAYHFQMLERGELPGNPLENLKELEESLPLSIGPAEMRYNACFSSMVPPLGTAPAASRMPDHIALENMVSASECLVKRAPHRASFWRRSAETAILKRNWEQAAKALNQAHCWYPSEGDYYLLDAIVHHQRPDLLPLARACDTYTYDEDEHIRIDIAISATYAQPMQDFLKLVQDSSPQYSDGRKIHFTTNLTP